MRDHPNDVRLAGVDPTSAIDVWVKKLVYPMHTLPTAFAPVLVGVGLAWHDGVFAAGPALAVFAFGWLVQLGGVLADNYFNLLRYRNDAEHPALVYALDHGVIRLGNIRAGVVVAFACAGLLGGYLVWLGGWPVVVVGLASMAVSLFYSLEVTDIPFHDAYFFLFFGPVSVAGAYYLQAAAGLAGTFPVWPPPGTLPIAAVVAGIPLGAITTAILVVDNVRDLDFDLEKNDPTLAVVIGERWSRIEYEALLALAYLVPIGLWLAGGAGASALLPLATLPVAVWVVKRMRRARTYPELLPLSPLTGRLLLLFALAWGTGLAW